jgi:hypothetical protein
MGKWETSWWPYRVVSTSIILVRFDRQGPIKGLWYHICRVFSKQTRQRERETRHGKLLDASQNLSHGFHMTEFRRSTHVLGHQLSHRPRRKHTVCFPFWQALKVHACILGTQEGGCLFTCGQEVLSYTQLGVVPGITSGMTTD